MKHRVDPIPKLFTWPQAVTLSCSNQSWLRPDCESKLPLFDR